MTAAGAFAPVVIPLATLLVGLLVGIAWGARKGRTWGRAELLDAAEQRANRASVENFNEGVQYGAELERSRLVRAIYSEVES